MLAALLALFVAVAVTLTYLVLTEEMDYASVRRRQLDAWAAIAAIGCMAVILYGNATGRRDIENRPDVPEPFSIAETADPPVRRQTPGSPESLPVEEPPSVIVLADGPAQAPQLEATIQEDLGAALESHDDGEPDSSEPELVATDLPAKAPPPPPQPESRDVRSELVPPTVMAIGPTPSPESPSRPVLPGIIQPIRTRTPTEEPTSAPTRLPYASPTPHCGDPDAHFRARRGTDDLNPTGRWRCGRELPL
jgi:hypothetical protein